MPCQFLQFDPAYLVMKGRLNMNRNAIAFTLVTLSLASGIALGQESGKQPFTHVAWIPADSDTGTIRFETAKLVQVPTRIAYVMNSTYCRELAMPDTRISSEQAGSATFPSVAAAAEKRLLP
jgi:hypothetical protein